ncbi:MurR/RpiR family transcriptional regulator [Vagococcus hydrophili]|uniref:MurR/RpiR family transcriptional regulator n=1 Tax=Vagococcus hydrophili TaxID=2714947 RepID=A0A6G8ASZ7_9ENTE|nr:MurR/RpiR family transcriptional regulator [Vagococcus hydrophili]QIL48117.1 MurR/RpiR family transcriptional regulator [Vagococcus hydrophili]
MELTELINKNFKLLSELDKDFLAYVLENQEKIDQLTIDELSRQTYISKSTIIRLMKKLGFSGYSEFKFSLKRSKANKKLIKEDVDLMKCQSADLSKTFSQLVEYDMTGIMEALAKSQIVYCYGTGFSQRKSVEEFSKQLIGCGKKVIVIPNQTELEMTLSMITAQDCIFISSLSGETKVLKDTIIELNIKKVPIISVTRPGYNFLSQHANYSLFYYMTGLGSRDGIEMVSFLTMHMVFDYVLRSYMTYDHNLEGLDDTV